MSTTARQCGDCSLCCKTMAILELDKPKDTWCPHFVRGTGCGIYETRPGGCRAFACRWLLDAALGDEWKPNRCKMVVVADNEHRLVVHVDPGANRPWRHEPYFSQLIAMSRVGLDRGQMILVLERGRTVLFLPDEQIDLGIIQDDDRIKLDRISTGAGFRYRASVVKVDQVEKLGAGDTGWFSNPSLR